MQKKFYQTDEFKAHQKEWDRRLAESGFEDAEVRQGERCTLKQFAAHAFRFGYLGNQEDRREAKRIYYEQLEVCLETAAFDSDLEKIVMTLKADGAKIVEICRYLEFQGIKRYRRTIRFIIRKYEVRWGIRNWKPEQLKKHWKRKKLPIP